MGGHYSTGLLIFRTSKERQFATVMPFGGNWTNSRFRKDTSCGEVMCALVLRSNVVTR